MQTLAVKLAYDGTEFSGFAKQKDPELRTVQGCLEKALGVLFRREVATVCAGRTDTGVHALGQYISFDVEDGELEGRNSHKMTVSLNALTDDDIAVQNVLLAKEGFSARFDAEWREYRYRIQVGKSAPLFMRKYAWWHKTPLDVAAMEEAASHWIGELDFKSFCKAASAVDKTTMRCVRSITFHEEEQMGEKCLMMRVVGNAFLHSMIRTMVGTLVEVGSGRRNPDWARQVLEARDRNAAGPTAPACGLVFWEVTYPEGSFQEIF